MYEVAQCASLIKAYKGYGSCNLNRDKEKNRNNKTMLLVFQESMIKWEGWSWG